MQANLPQASLEKIMDIAFEDGITAFKEALKTGIENTNNITTGGGKLYEEYFHQGVEAARKQYEEKKAKAR